MIVAITLSGISIDGIVEAGVSMTCIFFIDEREKKQASLVPPLYPSHLALFAFTIFYRGERTNQFSIPYDSPRRPFDRMVRCRPL